MKTEVRSKQSLRSDELKKLEVRSLQKGFTLIELLIYTVLFAIVLAVAVDLFFLSKTLESRVREQQEIDRNARAALLEMTQTIRGASNVSSPALGISANDVYLNSNAVRYFVNANGILQKTESGQTADLTSDDVTIENLSFETRGEVGEKPTVSVSFTIRTNTLIYGQANYITKDMQTTIQLR